MLLLIPDLKPERYKKNFETCQKIRQILSKNQNINKNSNADWSVWELRGKAIKTKVFGAKLKNHQNNKVSRFFLFNGILRGFFHIIYTLRE